jgi:hypothetical protein
LFSNFFQQSEKYSLTHFVQPLHRGELYQI